MIINLKYTKCWIIKLKKKTKKKTKKKSGEEKESDSLFIQEEWKKLIVISEYLIPHKGRRKK
jgi:hypothetical protein